MEKLASDRMINLMRLHILLFFLIPMLSYSQESKDWIVDAQNEIRDYEQAKINARKGDASALFRVYELSGDKEALNRAAQLNYIPALIKTGKEENLRKAYQLGSKIAGIKLGKILFNKSNKYPPKNIEAATIFQNYYTEDADAAYFLGTIYFDGLGVKQDKSKGIELLELSLQKGNKNAQENRIKKQ